MEEKNSSDELKIRRTSRSTRRRVFLDPSTPSTRSIVRVVLITLIILSVANFAFSIIGALTHLFFLVILAVFFAYLIEPLVRIIKFPFDRRGRANLMPRPVAIALAYLLVFSSIGIAIAALAPLVTEQAQDFAANLPGYATAVQTTFRQWGNRYQFYKIPENVQGQITDRIGALASDFGAGVPTFLIGVVTYLPWLILVPILAFFFLKDASLFRVAVLRVFPTGDWRTRIESILHDVNLTLAAYTRAQLISCLLIGVICTAGFYLIGLNYAVLLGIVAGVLEFIPLIGPLTIGIIAVSVAGFYSPSQAIYTAIFLIVLRIVHDYVTYPRIVRGGIHLHPLAIILSVLAGEQVAGIPGVFLSIPVVALLTVLYRHALEHSGSRGLMANILAPKESELKNETVAEKTGQI